MKTDKERLLKLLNKFLKHNSKARSAQKEFEKNLKTYLEVDNLSDVMDWYIDMDLAGSSSATEKDLELILEQARKTDR